MATFVIGVVAAALGAVVAGVPVDGISNTQALLDLAEPFGRGLVGILAQGALGFAIATLARSQLAGIGPGIGLYFGGTFATIFLPDVVRYLPFQLASAAVGGDGFGGGQPSPSDVPPDAALVLPLVWMVGALGVTAWFSERAEITG